MEIFRITDHKGKFFELLGATELTQIATMTIPSGGDSGPKDLHLGDQVVYVIEGEAGITINGVRHDLRAGDAVQVPPRSNHHIENAGEGDLFLLNVYAPPAY